MEEHSDGCSSTPRGGITETRSYFADGAIRSRTEGSATRAIHRDTLTYDARGKLLNVRALIPDYGGHVDDFPARYDGMGALIYAKERPTGKLNRRFLDKGIREGAEFVLATARAEIRPNSALQREVDYLLRNGYRWAANNMSLIPK